MNAPPDPHGGADDARNEPAGAPPGQEPPHSEDEQARAQSEAEGDEAPEEEPEPAQDAWAARQDLRRHRPSFTLGDSARFGGGLVGGDQYGVSGGHVAGDVILGQTVFQFGPDTAPRVSGEIPDASLERLALFFTAEPPRDRRDPPEAFADLVERLRAERVLVLYGPQHSGRRTAALVLLHRLGTGAVRVLDRDIPLTGLPQQLDGARGHVLCDLATDRDRPLREAHLLAVREKLAAHDGYLVITVGPGARVEDVPLVRWRAPSATAVLTAHLVQLTDEDTAHRLLEHPEVAAFARRRAQPREAAAFAELLIRHTRGAESDDALERFARSAVERQVQEWLDDPGIPLRDKAFLVALAAFDEAPYALTAELGDLLFALLQETENPALPPRIPVFGTSISSRLLMARARTFNDEEPTEWGPVRQLKAAFEDEHAAPVLLREVWTGHPSARPALLAWLRRLADDGRPLVRTRAAAAAAVLTVRDLPSAMALLVRDWAASPRPHRRIVAVSALALAHAMGAPNVPRIVRGWCSDEAGELRWTAIRAYALLGEERPEEALTALRAVAFDAFGTDGVNEAELDEAAASAALLLLSSVRATVLARLLDALRQDGKERKSARDFALRAFLTAAEWYEEQPPDAAGGADRGRDSGADGLPVLLDRYGRAVARGSGADREEAHGLATLWGVALRERAHTARALNRLGIWVRIAERDSAAEWALAALLPALVSDEGNLARLSHLLRTLPAEDGGPPPAVAGRLLAALAPHPGRSTADAPADAPAHAPR